MVSVAVARATHISLSAVALTANADHQNCRCQTIEHGDLSQSRTNKWHCDTLLTVIEISNHRVFSIFADSEGYLQIWHDDRHYNVSWEDIVKTVIFISVIISSYISHRTRTKLSI